MFFITALHPFINFNSNFIINISMWMELLNRYGREESNGNSSPSVKLKKLQNVNKTGKEIIKNSSMIRILPEI